MVRLTKFFALFQLMLLGACATAKIEAAFIPKAEALPGWSAHSPTSTATINHDAWDTFLKKYVETDRTGLNRLAYAAVTSEDDRNLRAYIAALESLVITAYTRDEQFAYWANLYNALTIRTILDYYPVSSIRKIGGGGPLSTGPWNQKITTVEGRDLSLHDIESRIMRPIWNDPRIHYAVNCAAIGCPNLRMMAFRGATLDADLDTQARAYINDPRGVAVSDGRLKVSSIYAWYAEDFGDTDAAIIAHLKLYADDELKQQLDRFSSINSYAYDWGLNDVVRGNNF